MITKEKADEAQQWAGMDGATAWHLIDRHASSWNEVGELMNAWLRANSESRNAVSAEPVAEVRCVDHVYRVLWKCSPPEDGTLLYLPTPPSADAQDAARYQLMVANLGNQAMADFMFERQGATPPNKEQLDALLDEWGATGKGEQQ